MNASFGVGQGNNMSKREIKDFLKKNGNYSERNVFIISHNIPYSGKIKNEKTVIFYDSIKDATNIENLEHQKIEIIGKWKAFDYEKFTTEVFISHCPLLTNSDNIMLEISTKHEEKLNWRKKSNSEVLDQVKKSFESNIEITSNYKTIIANTKENYILYKIKRPSYRIKDVIIEGYYLLGVKNDKVYRLVLFNFDESLYENIEVFLENLYLTN